MREGRKKLEIEVCRKRASFMLNMAYWKYSSIYMIFQGWYFLWRKSMLGQIWKKRDCINIKSIETVWHTNLFCQNSLWNVTAFPRRGGGILVTKLLSLGSKPALPCSALLSRAGTPQNHCCFASCSLMGSAYRGTREKEPASLGQREGTSIYLVFSHQHQHITTLYSGTSSPSL